MFNLNEADLERVSVNSKESKGITIRSGSKSSRKSSKIRVLSQNRKVVPNPKKPGEMFIREELTILQKKSADTDGSSKDDVRELSRLRSENQNELKKEGTLETEEEPFNRQISAPINVTKTAQSPGLKIPNVSVSNLSDANNLVRGSMISQAPSQISD